MKPIRVAAVLVVAAVIAAGAGSAGYAMAVTARQTPAGLSHESLPAPRPVPAIDGVVQAFRSHSMVGLTDVHGIKELLDFYSQLVEDPAFDRAVQTIVVEWGNSRYQATADAYADGKPVPEEQLRHIWQDTTQFAPDVWNSPGYEQFFRAVRTANAKLAVGARLKVILADVPIDWSTIRTRQQWQATAALRDPHMGEILIDLAKRHVPTLVIAGEAHLAKATPDTPLSPLALAEKSLPGSTYLISTYAGYGNETPKLEQSLLSGWKAPAIAALHRNWLGQLAAPPSTDRFVNLQTGKLVDPSAGKSNAQLADAWLYVGKRDGLTFQFPYASVFRDDAYWTELERRHLIIFGQPLDPSGPLFTWRTGWYAYSVAGAPTNPPPQSGDIPITVPFTPDATLPPPGGPITTAHP